ncbi:hypothetical protein O6H91_05G052000 [Diphasiastrum complanatum]|uniref:Uncharacterized protein n=1 Tax=Diphasiastrum complanatum TaxID=34168 RepID=A0ACC2DNK0_DIPCM|nr:hypothetical protein O6H91_05G052000 [Diphasiastrum complanatum]
MRTRGTTAGSSKNSPAIKKAAQKSGLQSPSNQEMDVAASPTVSDFQTPACDVKSGLQSPSNQEMDVAASPTVADFQTPACDVKSGLKSPSNQEMDVAASPTVADFQTPAWDVKSGLQSPSNQEMDVEASPTVADFQTPASVVKSESEFLTPGDDFKSSVVCNAADESGIKREQSVVKIGLEADYGPQMADNAKEEVDSKIAVEIEAEQTLAAVGAGVTESLREDLAEAGVEGKGSKDEEEKQKEEEEGDVKELGEGTEVEIEGEEVEEIEEREVEEEQGAEVEDEIEEVEGQESQEEEVIAEEEKLAEGGNERGQEDEEGEGEDVEEEVEVIEEIEYEDEEEVEVQEEEEIEVEKEEEMEEDEQAEGAEEEAEQFAKEYPDVQQVMPVSERQKRKKMEVFVGGLDRDATEEDLKKVFERVGEVKEVRLMKSFHTGKNKGFAFVQYATASQAKHATVELEHVQVRGRICGVVPSEENDILFIGNLNKQWNKETVIETLKKYGVGNIEELTLMEDPQHAGMSRGFAFAEFSTHKDAKFAFKRLQRLNVFLGTDRPAKIAWADPINEPDDEVMAQVKSIFVDGMPTTWDEEHAKEHFSQYGEIERIVLARNMPFAKRKDFGFVNYAARESALACVEGMNNTELADGDSKIKVKVKLSKPQLRTIKKVGTGLRGGYHMDWHRGRWGFRGERSFRGRGRSAEVGWGRGFESGWWDRGAGRSRFGRIRARSGRGFFRGISRGASFSGRHHFRDETSTEQQLFNASKEQTAQKDLVADRALMNREDKSGTATVKIDKPAEVVHAEEGKPLREKFECTMCGLGSDVELEFNNHQMSRVHKVIEKMRKEEKLNNNTPLSLLHEYASRHRCEVHYDIAADNSLGPFEVFATIGGVNTGIPCTRGVGKGCDKAKARQMAAADALEKIMDRIPDLEFGRPVQSRQQTYERPAVALTSRNFNSSKARGPPSRPYTGGYGNPAHSGGRPRSAYLAHENGVPNAWHLRTRNPGLGGEYEGRAAWSHSRGAKRGRYDDSGEVSESYGGGRGRGSSRGRNVFVAHHDTYFQRLEQSQGQGYGSDRLSAVIRDYGEALPRANRAIPALDDDPRADNIPHRVHPRARADHLDVISVAPGVSEYTSSSVYPTSTSTFQEDSYLHSRPYRLYDSHQPALDTAAFQLEAGIYPSSTHTHGPVYGGASDIHGSAELLAGSRYPTSSVYGHSQVPSLGSSYSTGGPDTGSYY